jgi:hypothetical protein
MRTNCRLLLCYVMTPGGQGGVPPCRRLNRMIRMAIICAFSEVSGGEVLGSAFRSRRSLADVDRSYAIGGGIVDAARGWRSYREPHPG